MLAQAQGVPRRTWAFVITKENNDNMMAITLMVPAMNPDDPPSLVTRVVEGENENITTAIQRAMRLGETSGLLTRTEKQREQVLVTVTRQLVERLDPDGETSSMGRADVLWKGNLITAQEWLTNLPAA